MADVNQLAAAANEHLSILNSPSATSVQISAANASLETFKNSLSPGSALQFGQHLLTHGQPSLPAIHYAFHVVDARLMNFATPWSTFPDEIRNGVRTLATSLITSLTDSHPSLLRQKSISLLVDLALREWPQRWPNFLDQILHESISPLTACSVLLDLSDRIYVFSDMIQAARRQELRHAMAHSLAQTLLYVTRTIETSMAAANLRTVSVALDCLHSFVQWADVRALFKAAIPSACVTLMSHRGDTRDAALRVLDVVVTRQLQPTKVASDASAADAVAANNPHSVFRETLFPAILRFISQHAGSLLTFVPFSLVPPAGALPALQSAFDTTQNPRDVLAILDADDFSFCIRLMGVLAQLGSAQFVQTFLFSKRLNKVVTLTDDEAQCAAAFVDLLAQAAASPSQALRHAVVPFFSSVLSALAKVGPGMYSNAGDRERKLVEFIVTALLQVAAAAVLKTGANQPLTQRFADLDDADDSQSVAFSLAAPRYASAVVVASKVLPKIAVDMAMQRLAAVLQMRPQITSANTSTDANSDLTLRHRNIVIPVPGAQHGWTFAQFPPGSSNEWKGCVEGVCLFVDGVSIGALAIENAEVLQTLRARMAEVFDVINSPQSASDTVLATVRPSVLRILHPMYMLDEVRLSACVNGLLSIAASGQGTKEINQRNKKILTYRGKALSSLSHVLRKLGNAHIKTIGNFWQPLTTYAASALCGNDLRPMEKIAIMESALASVLSLDSMESKIEGVERVLNPVMSYLSSTYVLAALQSPQSLLNFLRGRAPMPDGKNPLEMVEEVCRMFLMLEAAMHQVVRQVSKSNVRLPLPGILSRSVAPKAMEISCMLIAALHGIYASSSHDLGVSDEDLVGILQPSCREVAYVLNIDTMENMPKGIGELVEHGASGHDESNDGSQVETEVDSKGEIKPSLGETRSAEVLRANDVTPPDERFARLRERLRDLRRAGYEIMRAAIYSGAAESDTHLRMLAMASFGTTLTACEKHRQQAGGSSIGVVSKNINVMEPWHVLTLLTRIVTPLLSFGVTEVSGANWVENAGNLGMTAFLNWVQELVLGAEKGVEMFGETRVLDLTRDGARHMIARVAGDCMASMWPREEAEEKNVEKRRDYVPPALKNPVVRASILTLWAAVCSSIGDQGAARVGLSCVSRAVDMAAMTDFSVFLPLLEAALKVSVLLKGGARGAEEGAGQAAVGALLSIIRKWPSEFTAWLLNATSGGKSKGKVEEWVQHCVSGIIKDSTETGNGATITPSKVKVHRVLVRNLVEKIGEAEGVTEDEKNTIHSLPEKLDTFLSIGKKHGKPGGRKRGGADDLELTDSALDSLFGEGDPL